MRHQSTSEKNSPAPLMPEPRSRAPWRVVSVEALPSFRLRVRFADGLVGEADLYALIHSPKAGVFSALADPARFAEVGLEMGAVTWRNGLDLAPDAMHRAIAQTGLFSPQPMVNS